MSINFPTTTERADHLKQFITDIIITNDVDGSVNVTINDFDNLKALQLFNAGILLGIKL
jgi:hypothetical protein